MTQRRGGRPKGPERVPFTTTLRPEALEALRQRSQDTYRTARAVNRVIEEGIMGLAAVQYSETEDVDMTIERDDWTDEATVTVRLVRGGNDEVEGVAWRDKERGALLPAEEERAIEAARRKAAES